MKLLSADDDKDLLALIAFTLSQAGYLVVKASDGPGAIRAFEAEAPDLVILDINMPGEDGLTLARYLRERGRVGIVMLTANGETVDRVVGLEIGADDYLAKPCDLRELLARVRSVLRRVRDDTQRGQPSMAGHEVRMGRCVLNLDSHRLFDVGGADVPITPMEFDLLKAFAENPDKVLSRERLLDLAHNKEMEAFDRSVDTRIARLRQKIEVDPEMPQTLKTVRGAGYVFVPGAGARADEEAGKPPVQSVATDRNQ
jgi:two-component system phosphate regulon response regulator OmpR